MSHCYTKTYNTAIYFILWIYSLLIYLYIYFCVSGPDGVSLISPLPPDGFPLLVNGDTRLKYELRIPSVDGQSSTLPILCERTQNGEFKHTSAFHVQPNSPTLGCLSSFSINNGYSTPYITLVTPGNLSLLFSDPTAIYLTYGSCNSTRTSLTSATLNITITGRPGTS